ncbi:MAG: tetratricopeptide repeat protein [Prevotellaceae bacterium]|jgi:hypothetical protein|nr:tetratricopeptide repeat protein [Prevotellaceae bacterium]
MKNFIQLSSAMLCAAACMLASTLGAQTLRGVVTVQNSQTLNGKTEYVQGVLVSSLNAQPATSDANGKFTLLYAGADLGSVVPITIKLQGAYADYEVVNARELTENVMLGRVMPVKVYICKKSERERGISDMAKKLEAAAKSDLARAFVRDYAQRLSDENLDNHSSHYVNAYNSFAQGNIGKVMSILTDEDVEKRYRQSLHIISQNMAQVQNASNASDNVLLAIEQAQETSTECVKEWMLMARAAALTGQRAEAEQLYEKAVNADVQSYKNTFELAQYVGAQKNYKQAEKYYLLTLHSCEQRAKNNPATYLPDVAVIAYNFGLSQQQQGAYSRAEVTLLSSLKTYDELAKSTKQYQPAMVLALSATCENYRLQKSPDKAETYYRRCIDLYEQLAASNPTLYTPELAQTLYAGGRYFGGLQEFSKAERAYLRCVELYEKLMIGDMKTYMPQMAATLTNLALSYTDQNLYDKAEPCYTRALGMYDVMTKDRPGAYRPQLASLLSSLGHVCYMQKNIAGCEKYTQRCAEIYATLASENPKQYMPDWAMMLNNLGNIYNLQNNYGKARTTYTQCFEAYQDLVKQNPAEYAIYLSNVAEMLAEICRSTHDYRAAIRYTSYNIDLLSARKDTVTSEYPYYLARSYGKQALYNLCIKEFSLAEEHARKGLDADNTQQWIQVYLAYALLLQSHYYYSEAEEMLRNLAKTIYKNDETYRQIMLESLAEFEQAGVILDDRKEDVEKIRQMLRSGQ